MNLLVSIAALGFILLLLQRLALHQLGAKDRTDTAWPIACALAARFRDRVAFQISVLLVGTAVGTLRALHRLKP